MLLAHVQLPVWYVQHLMHILNNGYVLDAVAAVATDSPVDGVAALHTHAQNVLPGVPQVL